MKICNTMFNYYVQKITQPMCYTYRSYSYQHQCQMSRVFNLNTDIKMNRIMANVTMRKSKRQKEHAPNSACTRSAKFIVSKCQWGKC